MRTQQVFTFTTGENDMQVEIKIVAYNPTADPNKFVADVYIDGECICCGTGRHTLFEAVRIAAEAVSSDVSRILHDKLAAQPHTGDQDMTMNRGRSLFDTPEPAIGKWENQLGYRGLKEVWQLAGTQTTLEIEMDEDEADNDECWEVSVANDDTGDVQYIAFGTFAQCDEAAKQYMREHPEGPQS